MTTLEDTGGLEDIDENCNYGGRQRDEDIRSFPRHSEAADSNCFEIYRRLE